MPQRTGRVAPAFRSATRVPPRVGRRWRPPTS